MSWMNTGYKAANEEGSKLFEDKGPRRYWLPPRKTGRLIFIDDDPCSYWEHGFKMDGKWGHFEPCRKKNKGLPDHGPCVICDSGEKMWPSYVGLHTIINMTPWITDKGVEVNFRREIYAAKLGSEKKPGILKKLERLKSTHGRLRGLVFDVHRSGEKTESCGDDFTLVEKVDPAKLNEYAREHLAAYAKRFNEKLPAKDHVTLETLLKRHPWEPLNFEKIIVPRSVSELERLFKGGKASADHDDFGGGGGEEGGGSGGGSDDDVPY